MLHVRLRFYGRLNDLLDPERRSRSFVHTLREAASVKDTIESLGVPHPEVDLIVVNGSGVAFDYRLRDGDRVAVYPAFRSIDLEGVTRAGSDSPRPLRFVADVHVARLASLLRLAGFDTTIVEDDEALASASAEEERIALTRDVGLLKRSVIRHGAWIRRTDPALQLVEVLERFVASEEMQPFSRCLRCNTPLVGATIEEVADRLPPRTLAEFTVFRRCPGCERVYWQGSHYVRLRELLERARQLARRSEHLESRVRLMPDTTGRSSG